ncbi:MAG: flagellar hook-length control protein FliK [Rhodocyclales bacterium]|nr:flagellar hook-length control protein FliK [Rhodocyclales bacterium]
MTPIIVAPVLPPGESSTDEAIVEAQIQTAAELIQAVLTPAGTAQGAARADAAAIRQAKSAAALEAAPAAAQVPGLGVETPGKPVADMLLAVARNAHSETPPEGGGMPAKLAAPREVFALPAERDAVQQLADSFAAKSGAGMAPAAEAVAAAVPMHAAAASLQARHGTEYRIVTPVGSQHWETAVGNSLVIMSGARQDRADLVLTPPQLGRIEVSISVKGDEATAIFVSANPAVREALESALPRLREILADAGIALGQAHVGAESQGQSAGERQNGDNASRPGIVDATGNGESPLGLGGPSNATHRVISRSLVDTYA